MLKVHRKSELRSEIRLAINCRLWTVNICKFPYTQPECMLRPRFGWTCRNFCATCVFELYGCWKEIIL